MSENAVSLAAWLASDSQKILGNSETVNVLVLGSRNWDEVFEIVVPLSKKLKNGLTLWVRGFSDKPTGAPPKITIKKLEDGQWDLLIFSPNYTEINSAKSLRSDVIHALSIAKLAESTRIIVCAPRTLDSSPVSVRTRVFGNAPPSTEEIRGTVCEEDVYQVLEGLGFAQLAVGRLLCQVDLTRFFKGSAEGLNDLSLWLRVPSEVCKKADQSQLRKLCERGREDIQQPKTVFIIPVPPGFEHEARAQPSKVAWWPNEEFRSFHHHGLERWTEMRKSWETPSVEGQKKVVKVNKLSARELNTLVDTLTTNHDRIELPGPMRLDDLLDVLVDVWDSLDDNA